jgi:hypothetical protein
MNATLNHAVYNRTSQVKKEEVIHASYGSSRAIHKSQHMIQLPNTLPNTFSSSSNNFFIFKKELINSYECILLLSPQAAATRGYTIYPAIYKQTICLAKDQTTNIFFIKETEMK